ncbi:hypothetical protein PLANPX_3542 [Lacipirellula parvula]|uniref:Uncharacterized protein n=1 Tax=Lacipirellula parvula TaxID=2650471 RepID=A0A5K7XB16_9BACT|nr:hypothetical protein PLANPX_3542 [Lacipirellula parvula]
MPAARRRLFFSSPRFDIHLDSTFTSIRHSPRFDIHLDLTFISIR